MITKHEPPMGFRVIDEKRFQEWASETMLLPSEWYNSLILRTVKKRAAVGLELMPKDHKTMKQKVQAMSEKVWKQGGVIIHRRIVICRRPYYIWVASGSVPRTIYDSPREVLVHHGIVVE